MSAFAEPSCPGQHVAGAEVAGPFCCGAWPAPAPERAACLAARRSFCSCRLTHRQRHGQQTTQQQQATGWTSAAQAKPLSVGLDACIWQSVDVKGLCSDAMLLGQVQSQKGQHPRSPAFNSEASYAAHLLSREMHLHQCTSTLVPASA